MTRQPVRPPEGIDVAAALRQRQLWMFFGIAYGVTWLFQFPVAVSADGLGWWSFTPSDGPLLYLLLVLSTFGPTVAAFATLRVTGGPGAAQDLLRRYVRWRVPVVWYLAAIPGVIMVTEWVDDKGGATLLTVAQYVLFTVTLSILMTWVYNRARASVLLMIRFHAAVNTSLGALVLMFEGSEVADHRILLPGVIGFGIAALVVVTTTRGRLGPQPPI